VSQLSDEKISRPAFFTNMLSLMRPWQERKSSSTHFAEGTLWADNRLYSLLKSVSSTSLALRGFFRESGWLLEPPVPLAEPLRNIPLKLIVLQKIHRKSIGIRFLWYILYNGYMHTH
jgi:hypothetical protein